MLLYDMLREVPLRFLSASSWRCVDVDGSYGRLVAMGQHVALSRRMLFTPSLSLVSLIRALASYHLSARMCVYKSTAQDLGTRALCHGMDVEEIKCTACWMHWR